MSEQFTAPEEFEVADAKKVINNTIMTTGCLMIVAAALLWFLLSALFGALGMQPPLSTILALVVSLAVAALLIWLRAVQLKRNLSASKLVMSPAGVEQHDDWGNVRVIAWGDMLSADPVKPLKKDAKMVAGAPMAKAVGEASVNAMGAAAQALGSGIGFIGYGRVDIRRGDSPATRKAYADAFGVGPDGRALMGIQPAVFDAKWYDGRIGAWVAAFRPDILEQARTKIKDAGATPPAEGANG